MSDTQMPEGVTLIQDKESSQITEEVSKLVDKMGIGLNTKINQKSLTIQTQELKSSNDLLKVSGLNSSYLKTLNDFFTTAPQKEEERKKKEESKNKKGEEKTQEKRDNVFKQGFEKFGTKIGGVWDKNSQSLIQGMLGPLSLITAPLQDFFGFDLGNVFKGMFSKIFTPKKSKTKPTSKDVAKAGDAGSLYIVDQFNRIFGKKKKKEGGLLESLLGGGGMFGKVLSFLPMVLAIATALGVLLSNLFGKGGALSMFKEGNIFKGIMTLLFGKDLSEASSLGKLLGITKIGLLGASIGMLIGGPIGALIGLAVGMGAGAIKLGVDSGFFEKIFGKIKESDAFNFFLEMTKNLFTAWFGGIKTVILTIVDTIKKVFGVFVEFGKTIKSIIDDKDLTLGQAIKKIFGAVGKLIKGYVKIVVPAIFKILKTVLGTWWNMVKAIWGSKFMRKMGGYLKKFGKFILNTIGSFFKGIANWFGEKINNSVTGIQEKLLEFVNALKEKVTGFTDLVLEKIKDSFNLVFGKGMDMAKDMKKIVNKYFLDPVKNMFKSIGNTIEGVKYLQGDFKRAKESGNFDEAVEGAKLFKSANAKGEKALFQELLGSGALNGASLKGSDSERIQDALIKGLIDPSDILKAANSAHIKVDKVNDAIIKPNGQIIRTAPDDNIIATKNDPTMVSMGGSKTSNASMDITKLNTMNEWLGKIYNALISNQGNSNENTMTLSSLLEMSKVG